MSLFQPGLTRSTGFDDEALLAAMVDVEVAWLVAGGQREAGQRARAAAASLRLDDIAQDAENSGNPVVPLLGQWRQGLSEQDGRLLHQGLTSQDVMDSAMMLLTARLADRVDLLAGQVEQALRRLARDHVQTPVMGRTLGRSAEPTTVGLRAAVWHSGVGQAHRNWQEATAALPISYGGAVGTLRAQGRMAVSEDVPTGPVRDPGEDGLEATLARLQRWADELGLSVPALPWHVNRQPVLAIGSAAAMLVAAFGKIGADVVTAMRDEISELSEPGAPGRGVSSAMPHKRNPVLSILLNRSAAQVPGLLATLMTSAGTAGDERPAGAWHAEWEPWQRLMQHLEASSSVVAELTGGLVVENPHPPLAGEDTGLATQLVQRYLAPGSTGGG